MVASGFVWPQKFYKKLHIFVYHWRSAKFGFCVTKIEWATDIIKFAYFSYLLLKFEGDVF